MAQEAGRPPRTKLYPPSNFSLRESLGGWETGKLGSCCVIKLSRYNPPSPPPSTVMDGEEETGISKKGATNYEVVP